jgi:ATP-binding cassette subfamily B protein
MEILRALTLAGVVWAGAGLSGLGPPAGVTVGDLAAFVLLISRLFSPLQELSQEYQTIQEALAGLERIAELLAEPPEDRRPAAELPAEGVRSQVEDEPPARVRRGRLVMEGLTFGYLPGLPVLKELTLTVEPGERVAVVGRTGAGKTSLIHLLGGIYRPWQGRLEIDGRQPIGVPPLERRRLLGVVPQTVQLFSGSVWDNLTLGDSSLDRARAEEALRAVGAEGVIAALPDGLATRLGPGGTNLSYGQTQMLCLARAVVSNPPLLLLDEPTSGVDTDTEATLYRALREAGRDRTVILVSHRLTGLEDMDRVIILADGRVVQDGPPSALAGERGWYRVLRELESSNWRAGQS